jgi:hypothetical protein
MPLYRMDADGRFSPFEKTPFPDLEEELEKWIEANPQLLLHDEQLAIISRQPRTAFGKYLDLLAIDESGACVVVELKRGETPRDVVAQTLEYAAWVDALTRDQLDELTRAYGAQHGLAVGGVEDLYRQAFAPETAEEPVPEIAAKVTFNNRQRLIIVAEEFSPEVEQTLRYLRTKHAVDITGLRFGVHTAGGETIIETDVVVGRERTASAGERSASSREPESPEMIIARAKTEFIKRAATAFDEWVAELGNPDLQVRHGPADWHHIRLRNKNVVNYYYAHSWIVCFFTPEDSSEIEMLRTKMSKPEEVRSFPEKGDARFHVANEADLQVLKDFVLSRVNESA